MNEDFWSRQANAQTETFEFAPFGIPATITANQPAVLAAANLSAGRFSRADSAGGQPAISLKLVVRRDDDPGPLPPDLPARLRYSGVDDWLTLAAGAWGHAFASLSRRQAVAVLSPALAADVRLVSRYVIDHYLLNFILTGWAMLHASCVLSPNGQRLIVMIAPHNSGKSTTALHLLRAGFHFLADGMALFRPAPGGDGFTVGGYPIGEVKLRDDVLALFSDYSGQPVQVREQTKTVINLRETHPQRLVERVIQPASIALCFVERQRGFGSGKIKLTPAQVEPLLAGNSVFWDEPARLRHNTAAVEALLAQANLYHMLLGSHTAGVIETFQSIL